MLQQRPAEGAAQLAHTRTLFTLREKRADLLNIIIHALTTDPLWQCRICVRCPSDFLKCAAAASYMPPAALTNNFVNVSACLAGCDQVEPSPVPPLNVLTALMMMMAMMRRRPRQRWGRTGCGAHVNNAQQRRIRCAAAQWAWRIVSLRSLLLLACVSVGCCIHVATICCKLSYAHTHMPNAY